MTGRLRVVEFFGYAVTTRPSIDLAIATPNFRNSATQAWFVSASEGMHMIGNLIEYAVIAALLIVAPLGIVASAAMALMVLFDERAK